MLGDEVQRRDDLKQTEHRDTVEQNLNIEVVVVLTGTLLVQRPG